MCLILLLVAIRAVSAADTLDISQLGPSPRSNLTFPELAKYDGYPCETHFVQTEDNYVLGVHHIPVNVSNPNYSPDKLAVIYFHGLLLSSIDCLVPGPKVAHCYLLSDAGYDIYAVNNRGNYYSRNHTVLSPDDPEFWNFSFDEMATLDAAASIDYVLKATNKTQVIIVAHSQGCTIIILLLALRPEFNSKVNVVFCMSPVSWLDYAMFFGLQVQAALAGFLDGANNYTNAEIFPRGGLGAAAATGLCGLSELQYPVCISILILALGYEKNQINCETMKVLATDIPYGSSLKDFIRWGQVKEYGFCKYNFGPKGNMKVYGQETPPLFDLSGVSAKVILFVGRNDNVADLKDAQRLAANLKSSVLCAIEEYYFGHLDFIYSDNIPKYLTSQMLLTLATGNFTCNKYS